MPPALALRSFVGLDYSENRERRIFRSWEEYLQDATVPMRRKVEAGEDRLTPGEIRAVARIARRLAEIKGEDLSGIINYTGGFHDLAPENPDEEDQSVPVCRLASKLENASRSRRDG